MIDRFQQTVKKSGGFLFSNRYRIDITQLRGESYSAFANRVELPGIDFVQTDFDACGKILHTPSKFSIGDLQVTFFNSGKEYHGVLLLFSKIFNARTRAFGYFKDIVSNITVTQFSRTNEPVLQMTYLLCSLKSISGLALNYAEATEPQTFTVTFSCGGVEEAYTRPSK